MLGFTAIGHHVTEIMCFWEFFCSHCEYITPCAHEELPFRSTIYTPYVAVPLSHVAQFQQIKIEWLAGRKNTA